MINYTMQSKFLEHADNIKIRKAVTQAYDHFAGSFDNETFSKAYDMYQNGLKATLGKKTSFRYVAVGAHCDPAPTGPKIVTKLVGRRNAFPGGIIQSVFGFSFAAFITSITAKATGALGASVGPAAGLATIALATGAGLVQSMA